jgi:hypothetical protein
LWRRLTRIDGSSTANRLTFDFDYKEQVTMTLSAEQIAAIDRGEAVETILDGRVCVVLSKEAFAQVVVDSDPWTVDEMDRLAAETADMLEGDGLDEPL